MNYFGYWIANHNTYNREPYTDTNKQRLIKKVREIAGANTFQGNGCRWAVYTEEGKCVAAGGKSGRYRYRISDEELKFYESFEMML